MYIFDNIQVRAVLFYTYTIFYLGQFRAFTKEWYSTLVKGLLETYRFVNYSVFLGDGVLVQSLSHLPHIFSFSNVDISYAQRLKSMRKAIWV